MNTIVFMFSMFIQMLGSSQQLPNFLTTSEKKFVQNVIDMEGEFPMNIIKSNDNYIVVEFKTTKMTLKPDGYVGEMWIKSDGNWISMGTEEDAY